jgi:hypothetical protein
LHGLPARSRALLAALARTVDADAPYAAVFARRELLTGRAMQSMRTFYRSLDDLEAAGLITRPPQRRYTHAGLFGRAYLHLTEKTALLLGLVAAEVPAPATNTVTTAGALTSLAQPASVTRPSATLADGAIYKDLYPKAFQKRQPGQLPADLQRLRSLGFHEFLIFRLIREAREQGKRLSDVVDATWEHLKRAHAPVSYLRALLRSTADFRFPVQSRRAAIEHAAHERLAAIVINETLARCAGVVFIDAAGGSRIEIGEGGASMTLHDVREATPRVAAGDWGPAFVGALNGGRIRRATAEDEEAFHAQRHQQTEQGRPISSACRSHPEDPVAGAARTLTTEIGGHLAPLKNLLRTAGAGCRVARSSNR